MKTIIGLMLVMTLTACGTISGMGKDITSSADWTKEKLTGSSNKNK